MKLEYTAISLEDTAAIGAKIAEQLVFPACVYLNGGMGVGKTTLTKSILRGLGYSGAVTSPTYNLIQEYRVPRGMVYHMDLYRLDDPGELEFLALEDLWTDDILFLIEWPQKGEGVLQKADYQLSLSICDVGALKQRRITLES